MTTQNNSDIQTVINGLTRTLGTLEQRSSEIGNDLRDARKDRRAYLDSEVNRLLPSIRKNILQNLLVEVPVFVSMSVQKTFTENLPYLGIFKRGGSDATLVMLQSKLAFFLDQKRWGSLSDVDTRIGELAAESEKLDGRLSEIDDMLKILLKSQQSGSKLPDEVTSYISRAANNSKSRNQISSMISRSTSTQSSSRQSFSGSQIQSDQDDSDLWLYFATDMPTSFRTLMLSSMHSSHQSGSPRMSAIDSSINVDTNQDACRPAGLSNFNNSSNDASIIGALCLDEAIATDDRLGAFS